MVDLLMISFVVIVVILRLQYFIIQIIIN